MFKTTKIQNGRIETTKSANKEYKMQLKYNKNQIITVFLSTIGFILGLYLFLGSFGIFAVYINETWSNEPNIKEGQLIFTTNIISPKPGDFVSYKFKHPDSLNLHYRVHRLVAMENDIVEIIKGVLFINGENFDKKHTLYHKYKISIEEIKKFDLNKDKIEDYYFWMKLEDTITRSINDRFAEKYNLQSRRLIEPSDPRDEYIMRVYGKKWNKDNFGPFKIPLGKFFVMADNRDVSQDSRFIGPIDERDLTGVILK